ncbi:MAG: type II secretion system protein, partial [Lachnospiraceae bacterium]
MTMAELLIVVAIIAVLGGLSFVAVWNYQRSLGQLERDGIAKEIFVAAQNHLTAAYGEGYLGLKVAHGENPFGETAADGTSYLVVNSEYLAAHGNTIPDGSILGMMLPFGSIDETVRLGGSYLIHYQAKTGLMLDVFYCTRSGSPEQFNHELGSVTDEYEIVMGLRGENNKSARRTYEQGGRSILGWYGGDGAASLPQVMLAPPAMVIKNEEKLYVEVTNPNSSSLMVPGPDGTQVSVNPILKLLVTGADSGAQKAYELNYTYNTVILDDITVSNMHFANIEADTKATTGKNFIPGENLEIQAVVYSNSVLANVAYSAKGTTNSIFGSISNAKDTAYIGNIRHLENLDINISKLDDNDEEDKIKISKAEQTDSFSWTTFRQKIREIEEKTEGSTEKDPATVCVYTYSGNATKQGCYLPISPNYALSYDGKNHSISEVAVTDADSDQAGLFGLVDKDTVSEIKNLELIDFSIAGTTTAGALAGTIANPECTIANVLARNSTNAPDANISAPTAGGLIGEMSGKAEYSAAAVIVRGSIYAGGLIGRYSGADKDTDTVEIEGCYSGGHTANGDYAAWVAAKDAHDVANGYDVTGGAAGGLIGNAGSATILHSYSTCSVSGSSAAGGFAGEAEEGHIESCYAAGLI